MQPVPSGSSGSRLQRHSVTPGKSDDSPVFPPAGSVENGGLTAVGYDGNMMFLQAFWTCFNLVKPQDDGCLPLGGVHHKPFYILRPPLTRVETNLRAERVVGPSSWPNPWCTKKQCPSDSGSSVTSNGDVKAIRLKGKRYVKDDKKGCAFSRPRSDFIIESTGCSGTRKAMCEASKRQHLAKQIDSSPFRPNSDMASSKHHIAGKDAVAVL